jgi:hypothetical protein
LIKQCYSFFGDFAMKRVTILMLIAGFVLAGISPILAQPKDKDGRPAEDRGRPEFRRESMRGRRLLDPNSPEARLRRGRGRGTMMEMEKQFIGELEKIHKLAVKENAKETAEALEKLLAKRKKQLKQRTEMMERARQRFLERSRRPETERGIRGDYRQRDPNNIKTKAKEKKQKTKDDK